MAFQSENGPSEAPKHRKPGQKGRRPRNDNGAAKRKREQDDHSSSNQGEDSGEIGCICDYNDDDGFMIQCERCFVWQHSICVGISKDNVPDSFFCELCEPREVDRAKANEAQRLQRLQLKDELSDPMSEEKVDVVRRSRSPSRSRTPRASDSDDDSDDSDSEGSSRYDSSTKLSREQKKIQQIMQSFNRIEERKKKKSTKDHLDDGSRKRKHSFSSQQGEVKKRKYTRKSLLRTSSSSNSSSMSTSNSSSSSHPSTSSSNPPASSLSYSSPSTPSHSTTPSHSVSSTPSHPTYSYLNPSHSTPTLTPNSLKSSPNSAPTSTTPKLIVKSPSFEVIPKQITKSPSVEPISKPIPILTEATTPITKSPSIEVSFQAIKSSSSSTPMGKKAWMKQYLEEEGKKTEMSPPPTPMPTSSSNPIVSPVSASSSLPGAHGTQDADADAFSPKFLTKKKRLVLDYVSSQHEYEAAAALATSLTPTLNSSPFLADKIQVTLNQSLPEQDSISPEPLIKTELKSESTIKSEPEPPKPTERPIEKPAEKPVEKPAETDASLKREDSSEKTTSVPVSKTKVSLRDYKQNRQALPSPPVNSVPEPPKNLETPISKPKLSEQPTEAFEPISPTHESFETESTKEGFETSLSSLTSSPSVSSTSSLSSPPSSSPSHSSQSSPISQLSPPPLSPPHSSSSSTTTAPIHHSIYHNPVIHAHQPLVLNHQRQILQNPEVPFIPEHFIQRNVVGF